MFFHKTLQKEEASFLINENKRLKRENQRLRESLDEMQICRDEYQILIRKLHGLKDAYSSKIKAFEKLEASYRKELDRLMEREEGQG